MTPHVERPAPPYRQIVGHIRQQILDGELRDGDRVPSAREICKDWKVALATATKVLQTLRADGLVQAVPGIGTIVRLAGPTPRLRKDLEQVHAAGGHITIVSAELVTSPAHVCDALGIRAGSRALRRRQVAYSADNAPVATSTSWFAGTLGKSAPKLLQAEPMAQDTATYIADITGRRAIRCRDDVAAGGANEQQAHDLRVAIDSPVLVCRRRLIDTGGAVIQYDEIALPADRWMTYERRISSQQAPRVSD